MGRLFAPILFLILILVCGWSDSNAAEWWRGRRKNPQLLKDRELPKPVQPTTAPAPIPSPGHEGEDQAAAGENWLQKIQNKNGKPDDRSPNGASEPVSRDGDSVQTADASTPHDSETEEPKENTDVAAAPENKSQDPAPEEAVATAEAMNWKDEYRQPPTPEAVRDYQAKLEARLFERYNNLPAYGGKIGRVTVIMAKPLEVSLDGSMIRAEFDQLVYDNWGKRITDLEEEYFVVTFGSGGVRQVRSDPSIRVGLDMEKTYSERAPLAADPFRAVGEADAFRRTPASAMPEWWRPDTGY